MLQLGWLWPCPQNLRSDWKGFPRTNALAYWDFSSATKKKCFIIWTPDGDGGPDGESFTGTFWITENLKGGVGDIRPENNRQMANRGQIRLQTTNSVI